MQYMGGKTRIAKQLAEVIDRVRRPGELVWDPFCGGLSMAVALSKNGPVWATDVNAALINLYKAVQSGWVPPTEVSKETYTAAKSLPDTDPMKAFCGFGCSYGGKWFGGQAMPRVYEKTATCHGGNCDYPAMAGRALKRDVVCVQGFDTGDFLSVQPQPLDAVLYLDPPYRGTTGYTGSPPFNHELLVQRVRDWAGCGVHTFVSEYEFPLGRVVFEKEKTKTVAGGSGGGRVGLERLYYLGPNQ
jgi:DNA adenine methylase